MLTLRCFPGHRSTCALACSIQAALLGLALGSAPAWADNAQAERPVTLTPVEVKGRGGEPVARDARVGMLGQQDVMETPFSATAYTEEYIDNVQAKDIGSVLGRADASIYTAQRRSIQETFMIRGFNVGGVNDLYFNGLAGMAPLMRGSTEMAERIEVQKGPSAALSGMAPDGSVGGRINLVPKRAHQAPLTRLQASYESDAMFGLHADAGRRFGTNGQFGIRVNGVLRDGDTAIDGQQHKMALASLALDWRGEHLRLSADLYRQREQMHGINYFAINAIADTVTQVPVPLDGRTNLAAPWAFNINTTSVAMARVEWDINDVVSAYAGYGRREGSYDALITGGTLLDDAANIRNSITRQYYHQRVHSGEVGLNAAFATGPLAHAWALAATTFDSRWGVNRNPGTPPVITYLYALDYGPAPDFSGFLTGKLATMSHTRQRGVALADRIAWRDERVQLTLGVRHQSLQVKPRTGAAGYDKSAWSPTVALLVKAHQHLSVYASYIQGLSQGGTAPANAANAFEVLAPYKTTQHELGIKTDRGRFNATAALFQISQPSAYTDPATNLYAATGEQRNRGVEVNLVGEVASGLRLMGGASFIKAQLRQQLDPALNGNQAAGVPKFITRLGVEYDLPALQALALTAHMNHVGKRWFTTDNRLHGAAYTTFDLGARYTISSARAPVALRANIANLFNKAYWAGSPGQGLGFLGTPRTFMLSASVDF